MRQLGDNPPDRLVIAHLGNGVSVTAVKGGESVDTKFKYFSIFFAIIADMEVPRLPENRNHVSDNSGGL